MFLVVKQKLYMDLQIQRSITLKNSLVLIFSPVNLFNFAHDDEHFYIFFQQKGFVFGTILIQWAAQWEKYMYQQKHTLVQSPKSRNSFKNAIRDTNLKSHIFSTFQNSLLSEMVFFKRNCPILKLGMSTVGALY